MWRLFDRIMRLTYNCFIEYFISDLATCHIGSGLSSSAAFVCSSTISLMAAYYVNFAKVFQPVLSNIAEVFYLFPLLRKKCIYIFPCFTNGCSDFFYRLSIRFPRNILYHVSCSNFNPGFLFLFYVVFSYILFMKDLPYSLTIITLNSKSYTYYKYIPMLNIFIYLFVNFMV